MVKESINVDNMNHLYFLGKLSILYEQHLVWANYPVSEWSFSLSIDFKICKHSGTTTD